MRPRISFLLLTAVLSACQFGPRAPLEVAISGAAASTPVLTAFDVNWKERLDQPYVFLELVGDYADARRQLGQLAQLAGAQGVRPSGPPFGLFYDDPARVPVEFRRARVCWPVDVAVTVAPPLGFDVLSSEPVVYGFVRGEYRDLEQAYGGLFEYLRERTWVLTGPIREIYHTDPSTVRGPDELVSELQMPWRQL